MLPFWLADMDFRAPAFITDALRARLDHGIIGYTETPRALVDAVIDWLAVEFDWAVSPDWLVWLPGVVTGLNLACRAVGTPGDSVMMSVPVYYPFLNAPGHGGRRPDRSAVDAASGTLGDGHRRDDRRAGQSHTTVHVLQSAKSNGPDLRRATNSSRLAQFCERHDLLICSDEIHCALRLDAQRPHIPIASLSRDIAARTITLMAPTKTYNIPGLGCAFAIIPDAPLRRRFSDARAGLVPSVGPFAYIGRDCGIPGHVGLVASIARVSARQPGRVGGLRRVAARRLDGARRRALTWDGSTCGSSGSRIRSSTSNHLVSVFRTVRSSTAPVSFASISAVRARPWMPVWRASCVPFARHSRTVRRVDPNRRHRASSPSVRHPDPHRGPPSTQPVSH